MLWAFCFQSKILSFGKEFKGVWMICRNYNVHKMFSLMSMSPFIDKKNHK